MSYNGSGTFNINSTGQPVVAGTVITASAFNALTTDLATGLTTAITKDGQTTTTARITFAQGITSSLVTDSSSVSTGSIITAGGAGIAKNLYVGVNANVAGTLGVTGVATFSAAPIYSSLTASSAVATDASKGLVSVTNTGTGNNVLATSPTITTPTISSLSSAAATALTLQSAGTTAITVDTSQNVGIGVAPTYKLDVFGSTARIYNDSAKLLLQRPSNSRSGQVLINNASGGIQYYAGSNGAGENGTVAHEFVSDAPSTATVLARINSYGIGLGATTPSSGTGIAFPATQSASSDANTLDDYEEGTFTPGVAFGGGTTGITYSTQLGQYVKIGRFVYASFNVTLSNKGSSTGSATVTGLPFSISSTVTYGICIANTFSLNSTIQTVLQMSSGGTIMDIKGGGTDSNIGNSDFTNSTQVRATVAYTSA